MQYRYLDSPLGRLLLAGKNDCLSHIGLPDGKLRLQPAPDWRFDSEALASAATQLSEYFAGKRMQFALRMSPTGTSFQRAVLEALQTIPYGETRSYQQIARQIGRPKAVRAVGAANGRNPLPIVIPCHRVVGADGRLTGFGGGLKAKQLLLDVEAGLAQDAVRV